MYAREMCHGSNFESWLKIELDLYFNFHRFKKQKCFYVKFKQEVLQAKINF
jgi:hypothetical protein